MRWTEWARPALIFVPTAIAADAMRVMADKKTEAAIITSDGTTKGQYMGLVWVRDLAKRRVDVKGQTIKTFIRHIRPVAANTPITDIINAILVNDYPAIPITDNQQYYILTKLDLLRAIASEPSLSNKKAVDVMKVPFCVTDTDSIATTTAMIRDTGVERLVVVDQNGRFVGLVDELDLFKAQSTDRTRLRGGPTGIKPITSVGELSGERYPMRDVTIAGLTHKSVATVKPNCPLPQVIKAMADSGLPVAVVKEGDRPIGIITTKPILRTIGRPFEGVLVQLSGIQPEDDYMKAIVDEQIVKAVQKWGKFVPIKHIAIHIDRYQTEGKRTKYSIKARIIGHKGMWFADDHDWDITKAMRGVLTKLEKGLLKAKSKAETRARGSVSHFTEPGTTGPL